MITLNKEGGGQSGSCRRRFKIHANRSKVQGSTFWVKDKEGIKDPKSSLIMLIFQNNCRFDSKFWIWPDEADACLVNTHPNTVQGRECNLEPLNL